MYSLSLLCTELQTINSIVMSVQKDGCGWKKSSFPAQAPGHHCKSCLDSIRSPNIFIDYFINYLPSIIKMNVGMFTAAPCSVSFAKPIKWSCLPLYAPRQRQRTPIVYTDMRLMTYVTDQFPLWVSSSARDLLHSMTSLLQNLSSSTVWVPTLTRNLSGADSFVLCLQ